MRRLMNPRNASATKRRKVRRRAGENSAITASTMRNTSQSSEKALPSVGTTRMVEMKMTASTTIESGSA